MRVAIIGAGLQARRRAPVILDWPDAEIKIITAEHLENAKQLAEYYEVQTTYRMQSVIDTISLFVNLFIMIALIGITVVSSESAVIKPN